MSFSFTCLCWICLVVGCVLTATQQKQKDQAKKRPRIRYKIGRPKISTSFLGLFYTFFFSLFSSLVSFSFTCLCCICLVVGCVLTTTQQKAKGPGQKETKNKVENWEAEDCHRILRTFLHLLLFFSSSLVSFSLAKRRRRRRRIWGTTSLAGGLALDT